MAQYPFTLPQLDFKFTDLKPFISPFLIYTHYCHHHQTYVDKLNELLQNNKNLRDRKLIDIIKNSKLLNTKSSSVKCCFCKITLSGTITGKNKCENGLCCAGYW